MDPPVVPSARSCGLACALALAACTTEVDEPVAGRTDALRVCASGATLPGIDVSHWQATIDWDAVAGAGIRFAIIRISDGTGTLDREFDRNWAEARRVGILRGAYQFFRPNQDPVAQADLFLREMGTLEADDIAPVIDVEATGDRTPAQITDAIRAWTDRVEAATGRSVIIYTGRYFWRDSVGGPAEFADNPLWIANWGVSCPDIPDPWTDWAFWQTGATGRVAGYRWDGRAWVGM
jgi:lysozyme